MKINNLKLFAFITLLAGLASCTNLVEGINENPNNPVDAPANKMIASLVIADQFLHEQDIARTAGMWSGYFTGEDRQYLSTQVYDVTAGDFEYGWQGVYADVVEPSRIIQAKALANNQKDIVGVAQICEAHAIGTAAALWGDVPYSQAANIADYPEPQYDNQTDVYASVQTLLSEAITNAAGTNNYAASTTVGDWGEIAYTLKARYYLHVGNLDEAITAAQSGISTPENTWMGTHGSAQQAWNTYWYFLAWEREGYMGASEAMLRNILDTASTQYRGNAKTDETARHAFYYSGTNPNFDDGMFAQTASFPLVTFEENQLILAEALATNGAGVDADALAALNTVRATNTAKYGTTYDAYVEADFDAGAIANPNNLSPKEALLAEIHMEKWIALYGQIEGFTDIRRTNNAIGVPINDGSQFPERFIYPQNEINTNKNTPSPLPSLFTPTPVNQ